MLIILLLLPPVLFFGLALGLVWVPLPPPFPEPLSADRNLMTALTVGILGMGYLVGLGFYVVARIRKASRGLDSVFTVKGLTPEPYMFFGRRYTGLINGRSFDVNFIPARGVQRALLNVYIFVNINVRLAISAGKTLLDCRDCPQVMVEYPEFKGLYIFSKNSTWSHNFLKSSSARVHLLNILKNQSEKGLRDVYFMPGKIWLRALPTTRVIAGDVEEWLDALAMLAGIVNDID